VSVDVAVRPRWPLTGYPKLFLDNRKQVPKRVDGLPHVVRKFGDVLNAARTLPTPQPFWYTTYPVRSSHISRARHGRPLKWPGWFEEGTSRDAIGVLGPFTVDTPTGASSYHSATTVLDVSELVSIIRAYLKYANPDLDQS